MGSKNYFKKGDKFQHTFIVTEEIQLGFQNLFKDNNPLHLDTSYAKKKGYREKVVFGNILNGFISYFVNSCLPTNQVILFSQNIKYSNPAYLNEILFLFVEVADIFKSVKMFELKYRFENEDKLKVASGSVQIGLI